MQHMPHHNQVHPHTVSFLKDKLNEMYLAHSMHTFALTLIGIFIPIYLLQLGFVLKEVLMFYILVFFFSGLALYPTSKISSKLGLKHTMLGAIIFNFIFFILLFKLKTTPIPLWILALMVGTAGVLYWMPLNTLFAKFSDNKHRGSETAKLFTFPMIGSIIAPTLGGFIAVYFGFNALILITMGFLLISLIPLFMTKEVKPHISLRFS